MKFNKKIKRGAFNLTQITSMVIALIYNYTRIKPECSTDMYVMFTFGIIIALIIQNNYNNHNNQLNHTINNVATTLEEITIDNNNNNEPIN